MKRIYKFGFGGLIVLCMAMASWLFVVAPGLVAKTLQEEMVRRTGRTFLFKSGASMQFAPVMGVALHDVSVAGVSTNSEPVLIAKTLLVPATFFQILSLQVSNQDIKLEEPIFTMQFDAAGQPNLINVPTIEDVPIATAPLRVRFENGVFRYIDEPHAKNIIVTEVEGLIDFDAQNEAQINAAMAVAGERTHIAAHLKSLSRAFQDGSPFDFNLDAVGASISYGGRVVAKQGINLAGQVRIDTSNAVRLFKWLGVDFHGLNNNVPLALTAALESDHATILLKQSDISFSNMKAKGDISIASGLKPNVALDLNFENLNTDLFLNSKQNVNWSDRPFDLHNLNLVDLSFKLIAAKMRVGGFETGNGDVSGSLKGGMLTSTVTGPSLGQTTIEFDARETPAKLKLEIALNLSDAKTFMQQFAGMNWLSGSMALNGKIETTGKSQAEMIGALGGQLELKSSETIFKGVSLSALASKAVIQPITGWDGGETETVAFRSKFILADGIATLQDNSFTAPGIKITTSGDIDVLRQALNLNARVNLGRADGKPSQIAVEGPWAKPIIRAKESR
jgi:AsmA protein